MGHLARKQTLPTYLQNMDQLVACSQPTSLTFLRTAAFVSPKLAAVPRTLFHSSWTGIIYIVAVTMLPAFIGRRNYKALGKDTHVDILVLYSQSSIEPTLF